MPILRNCRAVLPALLNCENPRPAVRRIKHDVIIIFFNFSPTTFKSVIKFLII